MSLLTNVAALEWTYDKQLHAAYCALGAYIICDGLERTTDLPPLARWCIATATMTATAWIYEETAGVREPEDAHAGTYGSIIGATIQTGFSITLQRDGAAVAITWNH